MMNYFGNCKNLEELKKEYKKLAMMYHPDRGGNLEIMKQINSQYDNIFKVLKDIQNTKAEAKEQGFYKTEETAEMYKDIINELINLKGIIIEICGSWIWVTGNTKENKDTLKQLGFFYATKKAAWYWRADKYRSKNRGKMSLDDIRNKYGSDILNKNLIGAY